MSGTILGMRGTGLISSMFHGPYILSGKDKQVSNVILDSNEDHGENKKCHMIVIDTELGG